MHNTSFSLLCVARWFCWHCGANLLVHIGIKRARHEEFQDRGLAGGKLLHIWYMTKRVKLFTGILVSFRARIHRYVVVQHDVDAESSNETMQCRKVYSGGH